MLMEALLPLEVVILLIGGMALILAGALLLPVWAGLLPYYENGLHGLLLVIFALQTITLGKTPLGDLPRSRGVVAAGVTLAAVGMVTCFLPVFQGLPRLLLIMSFGPGGLLLLAQMVLAKDKFRAWAKLGGIFHHLMVGCTLAYLLSMLVAVLLWQPSLLAPPVVAAVVLLYGVAVVFLAVVLGRLYARYPVAEPGHGESGGLSMEHSMLLLMGVFMLLLGLLLIPVSLGLLPFSGSAQLGLLMVIFAVQMLASGSTPIGPFPRTWLMIALGLLFAALGIVSCLIPGLLVAALTVLVGVLNILGGAIGLVHLCLPRLRQSGQPQETAPPILTRLFRAQLTLNLLAMLFGASMLLPHLIPGLVLGVILAANGGVLLHLLRILLVLQAMQRSATGAVSPWPV